MLLGLVLVDLLADILPDIIALLDGVWHPGALGLLQPVALGGILGPDLASVAILLPEFLADLLLLVSAFLLVLGLIAALLPSLIMALILVFFDIFDLLDSLAVVNTI